MGFIVLAAFISVVLGILTFSVLGLSPGAYLWTRLHPEPQSVSLGSMLVTIVAIDSACWFVVLTGIAFIVSQVEKGSATSTSGK